jgi:hypothetical protein
MDRISKVLLRTVVSVYVLLMLSVASVSQRRRLAGQLPRRQGYRRP